MEFISWEKVKKRKVRDVHYLKALPHLLRYISYRLGLSIVLLSFFLCTILLAFSFPSPYDGTLFAIPVALAAWLFKLRGALLCIGGTLLVVGVAYIMRANNILGPSSLFVVLIIGTIALSAEGLVISYLRYLLDKTGTALQQAQQARQAEQRISIAYEQQRQLNQLKDEVLLNLSHELRTPLTEVYGYLELLHQHDEQFDHASQVTFLEYAMHGCEELLQLINNVLDAQEIGTGSPPPQSEEIVITNIVQEVLQEFDPSRQEEHLLQVEIPETLVVWADRRYMFQILRNLLSNAFKYAPSHTPVVIRAMLRKDDAPERDAPAYACISVKDSGPGIPPVEQRLLFEKFMRLKRDLAGSVRGTGLGLYICKQLVEAMKGRIWVESSGISGEGSCFSFILPSVPWRNNRA